MQGYSIIGLGLLGGSVITGLSSLYCKQCKTFESSLSTEQLGKYKQISKSRFNSYVMGLFIGLALAILYFYLACYKKEATLSFGHVSVMLALMLGVQYLYYSLTPKQYILPNLTNDQQREKYIDVYKTMKFRYHIGIVLGMLSCFFICKATI